MARCIIAGTACTGILTFAFGVVGVPVAALLLSFAIGPFYQLQQVAKQTALQLSAEVGVLPKVLAAKGTVDTLVFAASVFLMSFLADQFGVSAVYAAAAVLLGGAALLGRRIRL
ncbi:MFS transporter [Brevibacillus sp. SYP-B805]|uniref:MFS transporter n=1 Tax=Brevibacillus sp. SYP-B805 TaxID=1578199 RepID=UPI0013EE219F|nr:MFS transporter [Brevibacillus sp. SYP-B805]NGQ97383.1 MFS transporter [Brevibacillus sp. SYP-B805]